MTAREPRVIAMPEEPPVGTEWRGASGRLLRHNVDGWELAVEPGMIRSDRLMDWNEALDWWGPLTEIVPPRLDLPTDDRPVKADLPGHPWSPAPSMGDHSRVNPG